jgi:hypothetical protein
MGDRSLDGISLCFSPTPSIAFVAGMNASAYLACAMVLHVARVSSMRGQNSGLRIFWNLLTLVRIEATPDAPRISRIQSFFQARLPHGATGAYGSTGVHLISVIRMPIELRSFTTVGGSMPCALGNAANTRRGLGYFTGSTSGEVECAVVRVVLH